MRGAMVRGLTAHLLASLAVAAACCVLRGELLAEVRWRDIDEENSEEEKERELEWKRGWRIAQALNPSLVLGLRLGQGLRPPGLRRGALSCIPGSYLSCC